jgi:DNA repair ATPase RecN
MRIAYTRAGEPVEELAARAYRFEGEASATALRSAGKALRDANPFLRRLSEVPEGTIVVVPELENARPAAATDSLEAAAGELVVERLRDAAAQAVELLARELASELDDARSSLDVLRSSETRRVTRADDSARRLREATEEAINERMAAAEGLGKYRHVVAARIEKDLDELLAALHPTRSASKRRR